MLNRECFENYLCLVQGVALLNSSSISPEDIKLSDLLLDQFLYGFQTLYGRRHMSHNIHMISHLPRSVECLGPLWATSCFQFEDMNGRIVKLVHGTRHAGLQICSNLKVLTQLPLMVNNLENDSVKAYCNSLRYKSSFSQKNVFKKIDKNVYCHQQFSCLNSDTLWILTELIKLGFLSHQTENCVKLFHHLQIDKLLYVSSSYTRGKRVSSFVKYLKDGSPEFT